MAITLNNKTKLTTQAEKLFIEAGDCDPDKTLTEKELTTALTNTINRLVELRSPLLMKIYQQYEKAGKLPSLNSGVLTTYSMRECNVKNTSWPERQIRK